MKSAGLVLLCGLLYSVNAGAQTQAGGQAGASASGQASAQANKNGTQASANGDTSAAASARGAHGSAVIADGTAFNATLDKPLDSKKCKPGEPVTAHTTEPVKSGGKTVLPKGTKMVGHVTEASARANGQADSSLGIVFDKAVMKNGEQMPMNVAIQALGAASSGASAGVDDLELTSDTAAGGYSGGAVSGGGGRGALGGATSTAGKTTGAVTNTAAGVGNTAGGTVNTAGRATSGVTGATSGAAGTLNAAGQFSSNSHGVFGMNGMNLSTVGASSAQGSLITSTGKNVHLDDGTRMLLVSQASASAAH